LKDHIASLFVLLSALFTGNALHAQVLSGSELSSLNQHITGVAGLSETQLYELRDVLIENADQVAVNASAIEAAFATIQPFGWQHLYRSALPCRRWHSDSSRDANFLRLHV